MDVCSLLGMEIPYICWPAQPDDPSTIRVASVIAFSALCLYVCSLFSVTFFLILLQWPIASIIDRLRHSRCQNYRIELPDIIGHLKVALLASWWQKMEKKILIHISAVWRATELKFGIWANYSKIYYWQLFWCHGSHLGVLDLGEGP